jgi:hypothetical protein
VLDIQEAVLEMTKRLDSLLQFASSGRRNPLVHRRVSLVVEKAIAAVKFHPDGQNVSITVGKFSSAEADIDARNLQSAIYNLLLNACQAATRSKSAQAIWHKPQMDHCGSPDSSGREFPRLSRGGSRSLTLWGVHPETPSREPPSTLQGETGWTNSRA